MLDNVWEHNQTLEISKAKFFKIYLSTDLSSGEIITNYVANYLEFS